ncbi:MAG: YHYH protein [Pseudomonadota bacterium]
MGKRWHDVASPSINRGKRAGLVIGSMVAAWLSGAPAADGQTVTEIVATATSDPDRVALTDVILTGTSPDCADHAFTYVSEVEDLQQIRVYPGAVIVTSDANTCRILSNSIPNHSFGAGSARDFATPVAEIAADFTIPRQPQAAARPSALSHGRFDAVLLNGVVVHILAAGCYNPDGRRSDQYGNVMSGCRANDPWLLDPMSPWVSFQEDDHHGHAQPDGRYHYHGNPMALFDDAPGPDGSPVIGFAADGFPIFGSYFRDETGTVRKAISGYVLRDGERPDGYGDPGGTYNGMYRADYAFVGTGDLDECNGMTVNGVYGYYVTDTFPWILACLTGTPDSSFERGAQ